jgi:transcriptional regulator with XRE-family HTH domain
MKESFSRLESQLDNSEFRHAYAASFMNSFVAAQIKTIREQRELTQSSLAEMVGTKQAGISRLENVNYDAWKVETLRKLAKAFDVRLRISFEEFDSLVDEIDRFGKPSLQREDYESSKSIRTAPEATVPPSENLLKALDPTRKIAPSRETALQQEAMRKEEKNAINIGAAGKGLRLLTTGGDDTGNRNLPPGSHDLSGQQMQVPKEPEHPTGVQFG